MGKHTPGPWKLAESTRSVFNIEDSDGIGVTECWLRQSEDETTANANLIAAAPDLLAFVEEIVTAGGRYSYHSYLNETLIIADAYKLLRKARGEDNG